MSNLNEELLAGDLRDLVDNIFEIDSYRSKMGEDADIVVLSFNVRSVDAAKDLVNFVERGYDFVMDGDFTPGELRDTKYKVFVELQRTRKVVNQIIELLNGIEKLTNIDDFKFRYYKSFHSVEATPKELTDAIPTNKDDYEERKKQQHMNNFSNFFNRSYLESVNVENDDIIFQKKFAEPLRMKIKAFGDKKEVFENLTGAYMFERNDIGEIMYLSKYIGEYNIAKVGTDFVLENETKALVLHKI
jgi:hypothetical protein